MSNEEVFEARSVVASAAEMGLYSGGVGLFVSTIQNALSSHNRGAMGVFTRSGGTIGFFALMGATYALVDTLTANSRREHDSLNSAAGGCAAGLMAGARMRSIPYGLASCAILGGLMGTFDATGANLAGQWRSDTLASAEEKRKQFFKQRSTQALGGESNS